MTYTRLFARDQHQHRPAVRLPFVFTHFLAVVVPLIFADVPTLTQSIFAQLLPQLLSEPQASVASSSKCVSATLVAGGGGL